MGWSLPSPHPHRGRRQTVRPQTRFECAKLWHRVHGMAAQPRHGAFGCASCSGKKRVKMLLI